MSVRPPEFPRIPDVRYSRSRRHCAECRRRSYFVFHYGPGGNSFRLCWEHMSTVERVAVCLEYEG